MMNACASVRQTEADGMPVLSDMSDGSDKSDRSDKSNKKQSNH